MLPVTRNPEVAVTRHQVGLLDYHTKNERVHPLISGTQFLKRNNFIFQPSIFRGEAPNPKLNFHLPPLMWYVTCRGMSNDMSQTKQDLSHCVLVGWRCLFIVLKQETSTTIDFLEGGYLSTFSSSPTDVSQATKATPDKKMIKVKSKLFKNKKEHHLTPDPPQKKQDVYPRQQ